MAGIILTLNRYHQIHIISQRFSNLISTTIQINIVICFVTFIKKVPVHFIEYIYFLQNNIILIK